MAGSSHPRHLGRPLEGGAEIAGLIVLNLVRNRSRTMLTAVGVGIGVASIVAMLSLTEGLKRSVSSLSHLGGADLGLFQRDVADPTASVLPASLAARVAAQPGVRAVSPIRLVTDALPEAPSAIVFAAPASSFAFRRLVITHGHRPRGEQAIVGDALAGSLGVGVGDTLSLKGRPFRVVGVYHAGVSYEDGGVVVTPTWARALAAGTSGVTTIGVTLAGDAQPGVVGPQLERAFPGTTTISSPEQAARANPSFEIVSKSVLVIAFIAVLIGAVAVTNTIAMAILERQREIALLSAIGWSRPQIGTLILGEGLGVGLVGAVLGLALGVAVSHIVVGLLSASGFVSPAVTAWVLARGLLIGLAIGVLGGLYPAWRVTRIPPASLLGRV